MYSFSDVDREVRSFAASLPVNAFISASAASLSSCDIVDYPRSAQEAFSTEEMGVPDCSNSRMTVLGYVPQFCYDGVHDQSEVGQAIMCPILTCLDLSGFLFIPNYFSFEDQLCLANECLRVYSNTPNRSNVSHEDAVDIYRQKSSSECRGSTVEYDVSGLGQAEHRFVLAEAHGSKVQERIGTYWPIHQTRSSTDFERLRWVTLGHQYDWSRRCYHSAAHGEEVQLPDALSLVAQHIAQQVDSAVERFSSTKGVSATTKAKCKEHLDCPLFPGYRPNAAIMNIYRGKDRLGGHIDDAEMGREKRPHPLISISIGTPCFFLVAKAYTTTEKPLCVVLRSGDVVILAGPARYFVHGVPRLLPSRVTEASRMRVLSRRERRRRLRENTAGCETSQQVVETEREKSCSAAEAMPCSMDAFLLYCDKLKTVTFSDVAEQADEQNVAVVHSCRVYERSYERRATLLETLKQCRLNVSIRQA